MNSFELINPRSVAEAVKLLASSSGRGAKRRVALLAGGSDLLSELQDHIAEPERVINLNHIPGLDKLTYHPSRGLTVGALVKQSARETYNNVNEQNPGLSQTPP